MFLTNIRFASTIMMFSSIAASYPICYTIVGNNVCRQLMHTSRKFQSDKMFKWKSDKNIISDTNIVHEIALMYFDSAKYLRLFYSIDKSFVLKC